MNANRSHHSGFSLVEVMIAMFLFTLGLFGFFALSFQLRDTRSLSEDFTEASLLTGATLESLRAGGAPAFTAGSSTSQPPYTLSWSLLTNGASGAKHVRVVASWTDLHARLHTQMVDSVISP